MAIGGREVRVATGQSTTITASDRERNQQIRAWANANGYEVSERGTSLLRGGLRLRAGRGCCNNPGPVAAEALSAQEGRRLRGDITLAADRGRFTLEHRPLVAIGHGRARAGLSVVDRPHGVADENTTSPPTSDSPRTGSKHVV
jgi:hypothetical protein